MMRRQFGAAVVLAAGLVALASAQETRKVESDPAEWVPADALAYLGITDVAGVQADFESTTDYKMMQDKELAKATGETDQPGIFRQLRARLAKLVDVDPEHLVSPLAGRLAVYAIAPPGARPDDVAGVLIAGVGDAELMQQYVTAAVKNLKGMAKEYEAVSAGSDTIHVFTFEANEKADEKSGDSESEADEFALEEEGPSLLSELAGEELTAEMLPEKLAACVSRDRLILTTSLDQARRVLSQEKGGETLARTEDHRALLAQLKPTGPVRLLVNMPRVLELAKADSNGDEKMLRTVIAETGADCLRSVVGDLRVGAKSFDSKLNIMFLMRSERTGLAKILSMKNQPVAPAPSITANTGIYASLNIDPPALLEEILKMMARSDPAAAEAARAALDGFKGPDDQLLNLRKDVIEFLSGPLRLAIAFNPPYGPASVKPLLTLNHRNREALARLVSMLPGATPRDFRGAQIYESPITHGLGVALTRDQILAGTAPAIETALTGEDARPLAEDPAFRDALRFVPGEAWGVLYWDQRRVLEAMVELSKKPDELTGDPFVMGIMTGLHLNGVDLSNLPPKVLEYARSVLMTAATTTDGLQFTFVQLKPKEKHSD